MSQEFLSNKDLGMAHAGAPDKHATTARGNKAHGHSYERNVGEMERYLSLGGGLGLVLAGLRQRGWLGVFLAGLGAGLIGRGVSGYCLLYDKAKISTAPSSRPGVPDNLGVKVEQAFLINRPRAELFRFFRDFRNIPRFMKRIERVDILDDKHSHWVARLDADRILEWDMRIINEHPEQLIAWESLPGSAIESAGSVRFEPAPVEFGEGTEVKVVMEYNIPGNFFHTLQARLFGSEEEAPFLQEDLLNLKLFLEEERITARQQAHQNRPNRQ